MASCSSSETNVETNPRFDWYQSEVQVVLTLFVKNVQSDGCSVDIKENEVSVALTTASGLNVRRSFPLERLINPSKSTYKVLPSKLEIKLSKTDGTHWTRLERVPEAPKPVKTQPRDWDKLAKELYENPEQMEISQLFQKIYEEGSDEVKKAMNKSFLESGGTELNTNWGAVKKDTVSVKPPDGMEWRKWEE